jgi:hypothetical protein
VTRSLTVPEPELSAGELQARFERLQARLVPLWRSIERFTPDDQTIVVVPSITVDYELRGSAAQAYEERYLFMLLLLRQPRAHMVYVTSQTIQPEVIDYYLGLLPGVIPSHARRRLQLVAPNDGGPQPLTVKLLQRPRLLEQIRSLIRNPERAHLAPFNTTVHERDLALRLGIPMYGADPRHVRFGTKTGCRRLFRETGVAHPAGVEDVHSESDLLDALLQLRTEHPEIDQVMLKHNEGVSGDGNAVVDLRGLERRPSRDELRSRVRSMRLEAKQVGTQQYLDKLDRKGGVVEQRIVAEQLHSPSVQLRITPLGQVQLLSTHDQLLGGPSGQTFQGCLFPANESYAAVISREAFKVGRRLAQEGVLGRFALDFLVARTPRGYDPYAIEINLRKGGTTHPFLTLQFLTDGSYEPESAMFTSARGAWKYFVASDCVCSSRYRVFQPGDLFDLAVRHGLHYDHARETGVVFHMMTALGDLGRTGLTAVENSRPAARALYERTISVLDSEAREALAPRPLPEV